MSFTKGDWEVVETIYPTLHRYHITSSEGKVALTDSEANAHLIAASPDLYEALKLMEDWLTHGNPKGVTGFQLQQATIKALSKVEEK